MSVFSQSGKDSRPDQRSVAVLRAVFTPAVIVFAIIMLSLLIGFQSVSLGRIVLVVSVECLLAVYLYLTRAAAAPVGKVGTVIPFLLLALALLAIFQYGQVSLTALPLVTLIAVIAYRGPWNLMLSLIYVVLGASCYYLSSLKGEAVYAERIIVSALLFVWPLVTLSRAGQIDQFTRRRAMAQLLFSSGVVSALFVFLPESKNTAVTIIGTLICIGLGFIVARRALSDQLCISIAVLALAFYAIAVSINGGLPTGFLAVYIVFMFMLLSPRNALFMAMAFCLVSISAYLNQSDPAVTAPFAIRNIGFNLLLVAGLYQLARFNQSADQEYHPTVVEVARAFLISGLCAAALLVWAGWPMIELIADPGTSLNRLQWIASQGFVWLGVTWAFTTLQLENLKSKMLVTRVEHTTNALKDAELLADMGYFNWVFATGQVEWSEGLRKLLGYPKDQALDINMISESVLHPEERGKILAWVEAGIERGSPLLDELEIQLLRRDGEALNILAHGRITYSEAGQALSVFGACLDITEQKRREALIASQGEEIETIFNLAPVAMCYVDGQGRMFRRNHAFETLFGYSYDEVPDTATWFPKVYPDPAYRAQVEARWSRLMAEAERSGGVIKAEIYRATTAPGEVKSVQIGGKLFRGGLIATCIDMTDEETTKQELIDARQRAESASIAKSSFLANMSHEIRTPLNAIIGLLFLAEKAEDKAQVLERISEIRKSSRVLLALINDILDVSKIEAGELSLETQPFHLANLTEHLTSAARTLAADKAIDLRFEFGDLAEQVVVGDELRVVQILLNLLSNAIKFTDRGYIRLNISRLDQDRIYCEVEDTGIGMSSEFITEVLKPFTQADASTSRRYGGSGLGLTIVSSLVELMGGELTLNSEEGVGTRIGVMLPLAQSTSALPDTEPASVISDNLPRVHSAQPLKGLHILVAEDNLVNQMVMRSILTKLGATAAIAANGKKAVELIREGREAFDLVLMDMQMPVMDGLAATRELRTLQQGRTLPIVALTANAMKQERHRCLEAGMDDYLTKPLDTDLMIAVIRRLINQRTT